MFLNLTELTYIRISGTTENIRKRKYLLLSGNKLD